MMIPQSRVRRVLSMVGVLVLLGAVGRDFLAATTFLGDDYIFRAFARLEANPFLAFVVDKHGGEYYRPIPMLIWWLVERAADGATWPFAAMAFGLHLICAVLLVGVGRALGISGRSALLAGALFFVAPAEREAALWFSASTDLLSAAALLGTLGAFLARGKQGRNLSVLLAGVAFFSKETALVLPGLLLAADWLRARQRGESWSLARSLRSIAPHLLVAAVYIVARGLVLHGMGGANDAGAPWWGRVVQVAGGLVHAVTAYEPLPEWVAWAVGAPVLAVVIAAARRRGPLAGFSLVWVGLSVLPLPAAGWVVGARYFYVPAVGLFLLAALALEAAGGLAAGFALAVLLGLGFVAGTERAGAIRHYRQAVAAADAAVSDALWRGQRLCFVQGAVKDLDLALKLPPYRRTLRPDFVVLADVPASFLWLPAAQAERLRFLLARPPLPPAGAYQFGGAAIVGQARREAAPDLDEVLARLPELRVLRVARRAGAYGWQDRTQEYRRLLPAPPSPSPSPSPSPPLPP